MNRFDIVEAHAVLEWDYNRGGILMERPTNARLLRSTGVQLHRMNFKPRSDLCFETLEDDGKEVYMTNVVRWNLPVDETMKQRIKDFFVPEFLANSGHPDFMGVSCQLPAAKN